MVICKRHVVGILFRVGVKMDIAVVIDHQPTAEATRGGKSARKRFLFFIFFFGLILLFDSFFFAAVGVKSMSGFIKMGRLPAAPRNGDGVECFTS